LTLGAGGTAAGFGEEHAMATAMNARKAKGERTKSILVEYVAESAHSKERLTGPTPELTVIQMG